MRKRKGKGKGKGRERERDREGGRKRDSVEKQGRQREKTDRQPERPSLRENFVICSKLTCQTIGVSPGIISNRDSVESSSLSSSSLNCSSWEFCDGFYSL